MAEFCVAAPVLVLILWSIICLSDMFVIKHETMVAARYGSWLLARHDLSVEELRAPISHYFFKDRIDQVSFPPQNPDNAQNGNGLIEDGFIDKTRQEVMADSWTDPILEELAGKLFGPNMPNPDYLNVGYDFPRMFGALDLREDREEFFTIQSEHFVIGNSWNGEKVQTHHLNDVLNEAIGDVLEEMDNIDEKIEELLSDE